MKNPAAQALGRLAKGKPKTFTPAELALRKERLAAARVKRWPKKPSGTINVTTAEHVEILKIMIGKPGREAEEAWEVCRLLGVEIDAMAFRKWEVRVVDHVRERVEISGAPTKRPKTTPHPPAQLVPCTG